MATADILWAEKIEQASREQRGRMSFGPFMVNPGGQLGLPIEWIVRTPKTGASVPHPWPIAPAPGWLTVPINDEWSIKAWCALGGEWAFRPIDVQRKRQVIVSDHMTEEARAQISERVQDPMTLLNSGEAFAFSEMLFILPQTAFVMNSSVCHPAGHEPLRVFVGFRGHTRPYPEVITPGVFRACNNSPDNAYARYSNRARVAGNVVKQVMFEAENVILTDVQARGVLQHYDIIGATDMLDLSYDLNIAKWFSLNKRDRDTGNYSPKIFREHKDAGKAHDECSVVYTVMVRLIC